MKKIGLSAAALAAISLALWQSAQTHPETYPPDGGSAVGIALLVTVGAAPADEPDASLALPYSETGGAVATECVVRVPVSLDRIGETVIRTIESREIDRGALPDGIAVRLWPDPGEWQCALAEPGQACEALTQAPGEAPVWAPCNPCQTYRRDQVRGTFTPAPCNAPSEVDRHAAMTPACRAWLADAGTN